MRIQKCNECRTLFNNKPWIDTCPVCKSKNINHNEDGSLFEWNNYGDINFIEHGGCLVRETDREDCFNVIWLNTPIYDYKGKYKNPMMVARCYIDLSDWLKPDDKKIISFNKSCGYDEDYIPHTLDEKMCYCADLINYYGIQNFEPDFPNETGCGCYGFIWDKVIVGKTIAQKFLKECGVPVGLRK